MALKIVHEHTCDDCERHDLYGASAPHQHVLSIDGGPFKQLDLCARDEKTFVDYIVRLYEERGVELKPEPQEQKETVSRLDQPEAKKVAAKKKPKELSKAPPADEPAKKAPLPQIWCPLPHDDAGGHGKPITYTTRGAHAEKIHYLSVWDIAWEDPTDHLKVSCTSHAKCMAVNLRFPNDHALSTHIARCPLPRIDLDTEHDA